MGILDEIKNRDLERLLNLKREIKNNIDSLYSRVHKINVHWVSESFMTKLLSDLSKIKVDIESASSEGIEK